MKTQSYAALLLKSLLQGKLKKAKRGPDGQLQIKCPVCSQPVTLLPGKPGEPAFACPHCGKTDRWQTDASTLGQQRPARSPVPPSRWEKALQNVLAVVVVLVWYAATYYLQLSNLVSISLLIGGIVVLGVVMALLARRRRAASAPAETGELSTNTQATASPPGGPPPAAAIKQAENIVRDSRLAIVALLLPIIAPLLATRLIEWRTLRRQYPILVSRDAGELAALAKQFRRAQSRLWFGVVLSIAMLVLYTFFLIGPKEPVKARKQIVAIPVKIYRLG